MIHTFHYSSLSFAIFHYLSVSFAIFSYSSLSLTIFLLSFHYPSLSFTISHYLSLSFAIFHYLFTIFCNLSLSFQYLSLFLATFCYPKTIKYFTETKIFIKISIVFKNLFQRVGDKIKIKKVVHEKLKLNLVNPKNL